MMLQIVTFIGLLVGTMAEAPNIGYSKEYNDCIYFNICYGSFANRGNNAFNLGNNAFNLGNNAFSFGNNDYWPHLYNGRNWPHLYNGRNWPHPYNSNYYYGGNYYFPSYPYVGSSAVAGAAAGRGSAVAGAAARSLGAFGGQSVARATAAADGLGRAVAGASARSSNFGPYAYQFGNQLGGNGAFFDGSLGGVLGSSRLTTTFIPKRSRKVY